MSVLTLTNSNRVHVSNRRDVRVILRRYAVTFDTDIRSTDSDRPGGGRFKLKSDAWPFAVRNDLLAATSDNAARQQVWNTHGEQGFLDMLIELAPLLLQSLTIQAYAISLSVNGVPSMTARQWVVAPGAQSAEVTKILPLPAEEFFTPQP